MERHARMKGHAYRHRIFVENHLGRMNVSYVTLAFRACSEERHGTWDPLYNVGKIFAVHDRRRQHTEVIFAKQFSAYLPDHFDNIRVVHRWWIAGVDSDFRFCSMRRGDFDGEISN